jgi:hypothetical protein
MIKHEPTETKMPTRKRLSDIAFPALKLEDSEGPTEQGPSKRYKPALAEVTNAPIKPEPDAMYPNMELQHKLDDLRVAISGQEHMLNKMLSSPYRSQDDVEMIVRATDELYRLRDIEVSHLAAQRSGIIVKPEEVPAHLRYPTPVKSEYYASGSSAFASSPTPTHNYNAVASGSGTKYDYASEMDEDSDVDHPMQPVHYNPFVPGIAPPAPINDDAYDSNGDYHGRDRDLFQGPQALPDEYASTRFFYS